MLFITNKSLVSVNVHDLSDIQIRDCFAFSGDVIKPQQMPNLIQSTEENQVKPYIFLTDCPV